MDIKREGVARKKHIKYAIYGILGAGALGAAGWRVSKLEPASPTVERATVWIDSVKRGPMLREVKGLGTLVPEDIVVIPTLLLSPDQFDFGKPVKVIANGKTVFDGKVEKNVRTLLKYAAADNDRTMLFGAELHIKLD